MNWLPTALHLAGVDEAGRGPLAGPVVAAAVILDPATPIAGLADSKALSASRREHLYSTVCEQALAWAVGWADVAEIDALNILNATLLAMRRAVGGLALVPAGAEIDGNRAPPLQVAGKPLPATAIVAGDASVAAISAASIVAKVTRDRWLVALDERYPVYGFARHKGYGTAAHCAALRRHGPCAEHRMSFRPVREAAVYVREQAARLAPSLPAASPPVQSA